MGLIRDLNRGYYLDGMIITNERTRTIKSRVIKSNIGCGQKSNDEHEYEQLVSIKHNCGPSCKFFSADYDAGGHELFTCSQKRILN